MSLQGSPATWDWPLPSPPRSSRQRSCYRAQDVASIGRQSAPACRQRSRSSPDNRRSLPAYGRPQPPAANPGSIGLVGWARPVVVQLLTLDPRPALPTHPCTRFHVYWRYKMKNGGDRSDEQLFPDSDLITTAAILVGCRVQGRDLYSAKLFRSSALSGSTGLIDVRLSVL